MDRSTLPAARRNGLTSIFKNVAWLVGGRGFGAVCSLVYLAILSRSLGLKDFGHFALIFGTGQALVAITSFQTWQTLVRFGAPAVHNNDWPRFGRLAWFCATVDLAGILVGCAIAAIIYYGFGELLSLNPAYVNIAFWSNCALLVARMSAPTGIVRVLDRFDLGSYIEAVIPAGRLIASAVILWIGASVGRFLFAWVFFDLLAAALYWYAAWRLVPQALRWDQLVRWRSAVRQNAGIGRFLSMTLASSALDAMFKQGPLLAVGYFLGTSAAGLYRLADQIAQGVSRFAQLIARAVFPEFARASVREGRESFRRLVRQVSLISGAAGLLITLVAVLAGESLLIAIGGRQFADGAPILVPIVIGAAFELAAVSFEPVLFSTGHASWPVLARAFSVAVLVLAILALVSFGPIGVGWATTLGMAIAYAGMSFAALRALRRLPA